jgi:hypothetical protein
MSLGGFVLTAMSIIATMKDNTKPLDKNERTTDARRLLLNRPQTYAILMTNFILACWIYGFMFLYFSVVKTLSNSFTDLVVV